MRVCKASHTRRDLAICLMYLREKEQERWDNADKMDWHFARLSRDIYQLFSKKSLDIELLRFTQTQAPARKDKDPNQEQKAASSKNSWLAGLGLLNKGKKDARSRNPKNHRRSKRRS